MESPRLLLSPAPVQPAKGRRKEKTAPLATLLRNGGRTQAQCYTRKATPPSNTRSPPRRRYHPPPPAHTNRGGETPEPSYAAQPHSQTASGRTAMLCLWLPLRHMARHRCTSGTCAGATKRKRAQMRHPPWQRCPTHTKLSERKQNAPQGQACLHPTSAWLNGGSDCAQSASAQAHITRVKSHANQAITPNHNLIQDQSRIPVQCVCATRCAT